IRVEVAGHVEDIVRRPKLKTAEEVMKPLAPYRADKVFAEARRSPADEDAVAHRHLAPCLPTNGNAAEGEPLAPLPGPKDMAALINRGLHEAFEKYPETLVFGEDVAQRGGVYYVTAGLYKRFGAARVFNTLLDETTILGLAQGTAHLGFLP